MQSQTIEGYKKKPVMISIFALLYLLNPLGNILFNWFFTPRTSFPQVLENIANYIATGNLLVIVIVFLWLSAIPLSYGLYKVRLWAWYYFLLHSVSMFVVSLIGSNGLTFSVASLINVVFLIPIGYFISREIRVPYFNPRVRWWEQSKRFLNEVKILLNEKALKTYDFSIKGAFIREENLSAYRISDLIPIEIDLNKAKINCFAYIRWINNENNHYPKGFGVKFEKLTPKDKSQIGNYIKNLIKEGKTLSR
jgi:hypothetical protein